MDKFESNDLYIIVDGIFFSITLQTLALSFAKSASENDQLDHLHIAWNRRPAWVNDASEKLPIIVRKCRIPSVSSTLNLLTFPTAIPRDFSLDALQFQINIAGFVLTADLSKGLPWLDRSDKSLTQQNVLEWGGLSWAQETESPFVVVVTSLDSPLITIGEMNNALGLSSSIPILSMTEKKRKDHNFQIYSIFEQQDTQTVLTKLIEQIQSDSVEERS